MYIVGADSAFDHDLEKALFNIKCNTLLLLLKRNICLSIGLGRKNKEIQAFRRTDRRRSRRLMEGGEIEALTHICC